MERATRKLGLRIALPAVAFALLALGVPAAQAAPKPVVSGFSPACGPVGTSVNITGQHFQDATLVEFNGADQTTFTINSSTSITAAVPSGASGSGPIKVTTPAGSDESTDFFTVSSSCAPTISNFSPTIGPVGTGVTINGSNFVNTTLIEFGGVDQTSLTWNSTGTQLTTTVPSGAVDGKIRVTTPLGTAESDQSFDVTGGTGPNIDSISPTSGPVGTEVTIRGSGFTGATSVKFAGTRARFTVDSDSKITATVPQGATTGKISVTTPLGTDTSSQNFTVTTTGAAPTVTSFVPVCGPVGTSVVITGKNFTGATSVKFKTTAATNFKVNSSTQITAVVPSGASTGKISVTTPAGTGTSSSNFTVAASGSPTITSFSPTSGSVGTDVSITGTNYTNVSSVKFGGGSASFTVNSSTRITATVPSSAKTGPITVTNSDGTCGSATNFTVTGAAIDFHARSISFDLVRHLVARGFVSVADGFGACDRGVPVKIQRRVSGDWHTFEGTITDSTGFYTVRIPDRPGKYRAKAAKVVLGSDVCRRAFSGPEFN